MRGFVPKFLALVVVLFALATAREARAQVHWDVSAQAGAQHRFLTNRAPRVDGATPGPSLQLASHIALLPLVHVGGYLGGDLSPWSGFGTRVHGNGGLHVKGFVPFLPRSMRGWIYTGFGFAGALHRDDGGHYFEVPFGLGASYKLRKPWSLFVELGGRVGFAHGGAMYDAGNPTDRGAVGVSIGALLDL